MLLQLQCFIQKIKLLKYDINNIDYDSFIKTFLTVLDKHAPVKKKYLRANHANFVTKQLRKAIMKRSKLRNDFLKDRMMLSKVPTENNAIYV